MASNFLKASSHGDRLPGTSAHALAMSFSTRRPSNLTPPWWRR